GLVALEERERVALGVRAAGKPADPWDRLFVLGGATEFAHLTERLVDVAGAEVDHRRGLALLCRIDRTAGLVPVEHAVLDRALELAVLPAEQGRPELLRAAAVLGRQLEVHQLTFHLALLL